MEKGLLTHEDIRTLIEVFSTALDLKISLDKLTYQYELNTTLNQSLYIELQIITKSFKTGGISHLANFPHHTIINYGGIR